MHSVSQQPSTSVGLDEAVGTQPGFRDFQSSPLGVRLTNALASLPDQERVVVQAYLFSPNFDAIAMQLGMSRGDAQSLFWSALATLRMIKTHHNEVSTGLTRRRLSLVRAIPISDEAA
jgi:DNA-directed RNA polymerase specialized sigma24 family protein